MKAPRLGGRPFAAYVHSNLAGREAFPLARRDLMGNGRKAEEITGNYTEILPGRPTIFQHRDPRDDLRRPMTVRAAHRRLRGNAAMGDLYEVRAGTIALERARSEEVRAFAAMMVEHHTTSMHQMQSALRSHEVSAAAPDVSPPAELDQRRQGMIDHLVPAPDEEFDKRYLAQQTMAHQETSTLLEGYGDKGDNPQLSSFARGGAPMVKRHLKMLQAMAAS